MLSLHKPLLAFKRNSVWLHAHRAAVHSRDVKRAQHKMEPHGVLRVSIMRQHTIDSTGEWPRLTSSGAASATGVPKPAAPSIMVTKAQPMRKTSATGWPELRLRTRAMIHAKHCMCMLLLTTLQADINTAVNTVAAVSAVIA